MQTSPPSQAASLSRRCPSCDVLCPLNAPHICTAIAETLSDEPDLSNSVKDSGFAVARTQEEPGLPFDPTQRNPLPDDLIGALIGERYEILSRLDHGGMGVVYKARHVTLEKFLAVKILLRPQDPEARRRFLLEAKLASKLNHPNTVHILDFGVLEDGRSYLVMELLTGLTLAKTLEQGRMDPLRACQIALQIARGLCAVHSAGIVHRARLP